MGSRGLTASAATASSPVAAAERLEDRAPEAPAIGVVGVEREPGDGSRRAACGDPRAQQRALAGAGRGGHQRQRALHAGVEHARAAAGGATAAFGPRGTENFVASRASDAVRLGMQLIIARPREINRSTNRSHRPHPRASSAPSDAGCAPEIGVPRVVGGRVQSWVVAVASPLGPRSAPAVERRSRRVAELGDAPEPGRARRRALPSGVGDRESPKAGEAPHLCAAEDRSHDGGVAGARRRSGGARDRGPRRRRARHRARRGGARPRAGALVQPGHLAGDHGDLAVPRLPEPPRPLLLLEGPQRVRRRLAGSDGGAAARDARPACGRCSTWPSGRRRGIR